MILTSTMGATRIDRSKLFPAIWLKFGNNIIIRIPLIHRARIVSITDSDKNWIIRLPLLDPTTFLNPTSFARLAERAVARFM